MSKIGECGNAEAVGEQAGTGAGRPDPSGRASVLRVDDLRIAFNTPEGPVLAVNGVSFALRRGETLGVVGESGSGKSATLMSLLGLLPPAAEIQHGTARFESAGGTVDLLSLVAAEMGEIRGDEIGFIFQDPDTSLNPVMTIGRQVSEPLRRHRNLGRRAAKAEAVELLQRVGIADAAARFNSYPYQLSGGMRQRVGIAVALAGSPRLIIADEPTTALDVTVQAQIIDLLQQLRHEEELSVVWVSHDLAVIAGVADRVLVMYGGTVVESAPVDAIFDNPQHPYTVALLASVPGGDSPDRRLISIAGAPPVLTEEPGCCPFADRCPHVFDRCRFQRPGLAGAGTDHSVACFWDVRQDRLRWDVPVAATREPV